MIHTFHYICFLELATSFVNQRFVAILNQAHQFLCSERFEVGLQLAEHEFDRVVPGVNKRINRWNLDLLWRICHIVDVAELEPLHLCLRSLGPVDAQSVHEQDDLVVAVGSSQLLHVLEKLVGINGFRKDLTVLQTLLLGNSSQERQSRFVQLGHVHSHVLLRQGPLGLWHRLPGKHRLVDVDDSIAIILSPG